MDAKTTGRFIAELRKQKGYTQKELAEKIMVTDKAISRWETGKGLPDTSLLKPLGDILGVSGGGLVLGLDTFSYLWVSKWQQTVFFADLESCVRFSLRIW